MIKVELPDGTILEFPPDTPDDVIDRVVKSVLNPGTEPPSVERRVEARPSTNEMVQRYRALGYDDDAIRRELEFMNPDATDAPTVPGGPSPTQMRALQGMGERGDAARLALKQMWVNFTGDEVGKADVESEIKERERLNEQGGLNDSIAAQGGRFAPYAMLMAAGGPATARGALALGATEGALETATQPTMVSEGEEFWEEKFQQLLTESAIGMAPTAVFEGAPRAYRQVKDAPGKVADRLLGARTPGVNDALAERTGMSLSVGERTQKRAPLMAETWAGESIANANQLDEIAAGRAEEFETFINKFYEGQGLENLNRADSARKVQEVTEEYVKDLVKNRRAQATSDYRVVQEWEAGRPMVKASNYEKELTNIVRRGDAAGATEDQIKAAKVAQDRLDRLEAQYGYLTGQDVEQVSRAGQAGGSVWEMADRKYEDVLNARLREAIDADLVDHPDLQSALKTARKNYADNSRAIESIEEIALGKVIGKELASDITGVSRRTVSGDEVLDKLWGEAPSEFQQTLQVLDQINPEVGMELRMAYLNRAVEASKIRTASAGAGDDIDYVAFLQALGVRGSVNNRLANVERMRILFQGTPYESMADDLIEVAAVMADSRFKNFSNTDVRREVGEIADEAIQAAMFSTSLSIPDVARIVGKRGGRTLTQKAIMNRSDPRSPNYLGRGQPRPGVTLPRLPGPAAGAAALGLIDTENQ